MKLARFLKIIAGALIVVAFALAMIAKDPIPHPRLRFMPEATAQQIQSELNRYYSQLLLHQANRKLRGVLGMDD